MALDEESLLEYVQSCLLIEDGDEVSSIEDLEALSEMLAQYVPELGQLDQSVLLQWLIDLSETLRSIPAVEGEDSAPEESSPARHDRMAPTGSSTSSSISSSSTACASSVSSVQSRGYTDPALLSLVEIFPNESERSLQHCLMAANGDLSLASDLVLERLVALRLDEPDGNADEDDEATPDEAVKEDEASEEEVQGCEEAEKAKLRAAILCQYRYVDVEEDNRTHRPQAPKYDSTRQRTRYLNGASVDTRGQKYLEIKDPAKDGPQPAFLKALKKYKKH